MRRTPDQETWLCLISPSGGPERRLIRLATTFAAFWADHQHLSWGPDSQWLLAPIATSPKSQAIHRVSMNGATEQLTDPAAASAFSPALAPDARSFVFLRRAGESISTTYEIFRQDLAARSPARVIHQGKGMSAGLAWLPHGQDLVLCAQNTQASGDRETWLYRLPAQAGSTLTPLGVKNCTTVGVSPARPPSLLYGSVAPEVATLWQARLNALDSPAGASVAFVSNRSGEHEVWLAGSDGRGARRLTEHAQARGRPGWSPDGSRLAFGVLGTGPHLQPGLATVPVAGGSPQAIPLGGQLAQDPVWSRDGQRLYYSSRLQLWRTRIDGRDRAQLRAGSRHVALGESPDGRSLYYTRLAQFHVLCRMPVNGGPEEMVADGLWVNAAALPPPGSLLRSRQGRRSLPAPLRSPIRRRLGAGAQAGRLPGRRSHPQSQTRLYQLHDLSRRNPHPLVQAQTAANRPRPDPGHSLARHRRRSAPDARRLTRMLRKATSLP